MESKYTEKGGEEKREETLSLGQIDEDYLSSLIEGQVKDFQNTHQDYFQQREDWLLGLRNLRYQYKEGLFEHSSDMHVPFSLIMSKALHAKIFQTFSQQSFFSVRANNMAFEEREDTVKWFMVWVQEKWMNRGLGRMDVLDAWLSQIIDEGSGILKLGWDRWEVKYLDLDIVAEEETPSLEIFADQEDLDIEETSTPKIRIKNTKKSLEMSAPWMDVVDIDDFIMPAGCKNPQISPWVIHKVTLSDDDLKFRARRKKFDKEVVEEALERRQSYVNQRELDRSDVRHDTRRHLRELEGVEGDGYRHTDKFDSGMHLIWEWHGKAYVTKEMDEDTAQDVKESPQDIVVWYHPGIRKILGWTYLYRVSPSGRRPFYKADFIPSKERAFGIGTGELLWSINNHIDAVHNLKLDNGVLASLQFGLYRAGSTLKPDTFRLRPGDLVPVEDPNDVKFANFPYLGNFGENEERTLQSYGEKLLAVNDINLGNLGASGVAGALRNATGANFVDRQSNIQLHPHLDRIARAYKLVLQDLFILTRSRMDEALFFRVTGEDGKGIFGEVSPSDLRGDYDFDIDTDLAAASEAENQQRASLVIQNLLNPVFMQMGIVQPGNYYEALKNFLVKNGIRHPDKFITKPPQYAGPPLTKEARLLKILTGQGDDPPIENTVRPEENHEVAIEYLEQFKQDKAFGLLGRTQLAAYQALLDAHQKFLSMTQGFSGIPNSFGGQMPGEGGLPAVGPAPGGAASGMAEPGPLGAPVGEPNGPVI